MKRVFTLVLIAFAVLAISACTRDKPEVTPEPPATVVVRLETPGSVLATPATTPTTSQVVTPTAIIPTITPSAGAAPLATPVPTASGTCPTVYTVQFGDTLNRISAKYGVSVAAIVTANPGLNPNFISVGQTINVPCPDQTLPPSAFPTAGPLPASSSSASSSASPPPTTCQPTYTVQRGDWTYAIARRFGISVQALMAANPSINVNYLYPGQVLNVPCSSTGTPPSGQPGGKSYVVRSGDTLFSIAIRFNTTVYALQFANHLPNPHVLYVGQTLIIP